MKNTCVALILALLSCAAMAQSPNDVVQSAANELAAGLDGRKDELAAHRDELYALIDKILLPRFDRRYAAQLVLGRHWRDASEEERNEFIKAFYASLVRKYGDGILKYDQDRLEILPYRGDDSEQRTTVKTLVTLDDGTKVPVNYALVKRSDGWKMFDVTIEGISYVRNFRTELNAEIQANGLRSVIDRLNGELTTAAAAQ